MWCTKTKNVLYPNEGWDRMPTRRRQESSTGIYHIIVKGINNEKIYNQQREKEYFKSIILKHLKKYHVEIYCYCIMSNHAHFIIRAEIQILSVFMAAILAEYASYYNFKHHRNGHVFQNRFASECIEDERYFWTCMRYIHLNPVKANMIKKPEKYKYSSMVEYMLETPILIHEKAIQLYKKYYPSFKEFKDFHKERQVEVFIDTADEVVLQRREIALVIAEEVYRDYDLFLLSQVFEEKKPSEEYIRRLKTSLKLSHKKAKELCVEMMNQVENK